MVIPDYSKKKDEEIWMAFRAGSEEAFSYIYETYLDDIFRYCMKITTDRDLVKDCIQDFFVELHLKRKKLGETTNILFYILSSVRRKLIRALNKKGYIGKTEIPDNYIFEIIPPTEYSIVQKQIDDERMQKLKNELNQLPKRMKEALYLKFYCDLNYEEIASIMEVNKQSVYNFISRAMEILRKNLIYFVSCLLIIKSV